MIRKISIDQLLPGMFVVDLHKRWLEHSIWRLHFKVRDEEHIWRLKDEGIVEVSIDTGKGIDLPPSPMALQRSPMALQSASSSHARHCTRIGGAQRNPASGDCLQS